MLTLVPFLLVKETGARVHAHVFGVLSALVITASEM